MPCQLADAAAPPARLAFRLVRAAVRGVATAVVLATLAACGGGDDGADGGAGAGTGRSVRSSVLRVLVTNDDGYAAPGIEAAARALAAEPRVEVDVVAPRTDRSGSGTTASAGPVRHERVRTPGGLAAVAVDGFPVDAVRVALDELGLTPDLVVSGINRGQNLGPFVNLSGTVGAARAARARGIPAVAVSQGVGDPPDYRSGASVLLDWFRAHRRSLESVRGVVNLNVPTCAAGRVRGLVEVPVAAETGDRKVFDPVDCTTSTPAGPDDIGAFTAGFATLSVLAA